MTDEIQQHNEWAKKNIEQENRMVCDCGRIVAIDWMKEKLEKEVNGLCALCFNKEGGERKK